MIRHAHTDAAGLTRLAAIDVGTNSIRLIVAEASPDGSYRVLDDEKEVTRLGRGLERTSRLAAKAMDLSARTISRMRGIAEGYNVNELRIIGTAAVRESENQREFIELLRRVAGVELQVISAEDEARLAWISAANAFDLRSTSAAVVDIGGGSTEVVLSSGGVVEHLSSLRLGAVRLTERFPGIEDTDPAVYARVRRFIDRQIREAVGKPPLTPQVMIGTGGTFTALAAIAAHRHAGPSAADLLPFTLRGYEMHRSEVKHLLDWLAGMSLRERSRVPGLSPDRAEIIVAGAAIAERMMRRLGVNSLRVHDRGIRDGLILSMLGRDPARAAHPHPHEPRDRLRAVRHFARACNYEEQHSEHVAALSLQVFDQLAAQVPDAPGGWSDPVNRQLLESAAILHDIGYLINYSKHHKHSYHLIIHSDLEGFSQREVRIIANVARYHRRAAPRRKHPGFAALDRDDRRLVRALSAILRVADGLDRTHTRRVKGLSVVVRRGTARFTVHADQDPVVDLWAAEQKSALLRRVLGLRARFTWSGVDPAAMPADALPAPAPPEAAESARMG